MSQPSSSAAPISLSNPFGDPVSEKLTRENFLPWKALVLTPIRGAGLMGYLDGTMAAPAKEVDEAKADKTVVQVPNPAYAFWVAQDQQIVGYIFRSLSHEVLLQVMDKTTAQSLWEAIQAMFASQSRARLIQLRTQIANTKKGDMSASAYFTKMKGLADELAAAGKKMDEDDLISQILAGLDSDYNAMVQAISANTTDHGISLQSLFSQLLVAEGRLEAQNAQFSANLAAKGGRGGSYSTNYSNNRSGYPVYSNNSRNGGYPANQQQRQGGGGYQQQRQGDGGYQQQRRGDGGGYSNSKNEVVCQICGKEGHDAYNCWNRFKKNYKRKEKTANAAATSYGVDTNWYIDTGATDHITSELDKLTVRERYTGTDQVHTANGAGNAQNSAARTE